MLSSSKVYLAGHRGLVGSALMRVMKQDSSIELIVATRDELDLRDAQAVLAFFEKNQPEYLIIAAAKVGGIEANRQFKADFLLENLEIQNNLFEAARKFKTKKTLFLGSSCIYPRECPQPMKEEYLLTGPLEPTNEGYALAKIAGLKIAEYLYEQDGMKTVCPMPCNLYGPGDSFDLKRSHVLSALVKRFTDARNEQKEFVELWGTGTARREFLHVDDLARMVLELFERMETPEIINIGSGSDVTIKELAEMIAKEVGYEGEIKWDPSKPDGMPRKCLEVSKMQALGLYPTISLEQGIRGVVKEYEQHIS